MVEEKDLFFAGNLGEVPEFPSLLAGSDSAVRLDQLVF